MTKEKDDKESFAQPLIIKENTDFHEHEIPINTKRHFSLDSPSRSKKNNKADNVSQNSINQRKAQFRALIHKNFALQSKQSGTNICQVHI